MNDANFAGYAKNATDFLGHEWHFDCMGCAIAKGNITVPGGLIYDGNMAILTADPEIPIPGFLVVNVKSHIRSLSELKLAERHEVIDVVATAEKALKSLGINEITLVQEERSSHFHLWIFPNYDWMNEKCGKGISYLRDISAYAKENKTDSMVREVLDTIEKVKEYFSSHSIEE